jgi:hypothetical protein
MKKPTSNPYSITIIYYLMQWLSENDENSFAGYVIGSIAFLHDIYKIAKPENIEGQYENLKAHYAVVDSYSKVVRVKNNDAFYNYLLDERFDLTVSTHTSRIGNRRVHVLLRIHSPAHQRKEP